MAEETQKEPAPAPPAEEVVAVPVAPVPEKDQPPAPAPVAEPEVTEKPADVTPVEGKLAAAVEAEKAEPEKITQSVSFKEESNVVGELPDPQKKALDELKHLVQEALNKNEFTAPAPPPPAKKETAPVVGAEEKKEEKAAEEEKKEEVKEEEKTETTEEKAKPETEEKPAEPSEKVESKAPPPAEAKPKDEEKAAPPPAGEVKEVAEKASAGDDDGAKTVEAIEETVVPAAALEPAAQTEQPSASTKTEVPAKAPTAEETTAPPQPPPQEVFIWGIQLLADERSDVILLKFLRARDFKVKEAFAMLKSTILWRKEFGTDALLEEDLGNEWEKFVFMAGVDKEGHPVCYNVYGAFQDKELYQNSFSDEEKRTKFLRWRIQFLEKSIRKLDFSPTGINTIVQVNDLNNSLWPGKKEVRQTTNQALQLLQDNYPEFVAKQVFINVPWWYLAFNRMISPFLTQRTKSKFVFAGPSKTADTLFRYIAPEQVPVQYGGLRREGEQEFTSAESVTEFTIKPATKHTVEFTVPEKCVLVWEVRVVGWDVNYGAEFVPSAEDGYTVIVSKTKKVGAGDEPVIGENFKVGEPGKVVLTIDNQTSKKKKLLYRSKTKPSSD